MSILATYIFVLVEPVSVEIEEKSRIFEEGKTLKFRCKVSYLKSPKRLRLIIRVQPVIFFGENRISGIRPDIWPTLDIRQIIRYPAV